MHLHRWLVTLLLLSAPLTLTACYYGEQPVRVPDQTNPGHYKSCPRGQTTC